MNLASRAVEAGLGTHCKDLLSNGVRLIYKSLTTSTINMGRFGLGTPDLFSKFQKAGGWINFGTGLGLKSFVGLGLAAGTMDSINKERDLIGGRSYQTIPTDLLEWETGLSLAGLASAVVPSLFRLSGLAAKTPWAMRGPFTFNYIIAGACLAAATAVNYRIKSLSNPSAGGLDAAGPLFMNTDPNSSYAYMSKFLQGSAAKRAWQDSVHGKPGEKVRGFLEKTIKGVGDTIFGDQDAYRLGVNHIA